MASYLICINLKDTQKIHTPQFSCKCWGNFNTENKLQSSLNFNAENKLQSSLNDSNL